jgi:predicted RNase H-like nuclease (RuvC/YqgF family)
MEIQTEAQAAKVRAVMGAIIAKLREAKAASDKPKVGDLKGQYTTLQAALQEYKATRVTTPKQTPPTDNLSEVTAQLRREATDLKTQLATAEATIKDMRTTISGLRYQLELAEDEVRSLRSPLQNPARQQSQPAPSPTINFATLFDDLK